MFFESVKFHLEHHLSPLIKPVFALLTLIEICLVHQKRFYMRSISHAALFLS